MEKSTEKSVSSVASGNSINSKLRYPLRSALRSKEGKPPVPDFSGSSAPRRGRVASAVSQSTTVLDLSAKKSVDRTKPPRRLSIPNKATSNSSVKSVSSGITCVSESKAKRSGIARSLNETPVSNGLRSASRRKVEDLSSSTYWLSHIKLSESVAKHSISLGFFKLALHAGCEPIDQMKEELRSYARRNNLDGLADAMKELSELYNISEESNQMQISETSSVVAEETTVSLNNDNDVQSSLSTPGNSNITLEIMKDVSSQDSAVIETAKEEEASETIPQERSRRSLDVINVNQEVVAEETTTVVSMNNDNHVQSSFSTPGNSNIKSEITKDDVLQDSAVIETAKEKETSETNPQGKTRRSLDVINVNQEVVQESEDGVPNVNVVQPSDKKRANRKEAVPARTKKSLATNSANSRTVPESKDDKSLKKSERITKPRTKKIQEETKKPTKKSAAKEGEAKSLKQMKKMENKENSVVVGAGEEIQV